MSTHGARTEVRVHEMEGQPVCLVAGVGEDKRLRYQQSQVCENRHMQLGGGAGLGGWAVASKLGSAWTAALAAS